MGESINVIALDTVVAILAGFIMFPACFTYGIEVNAGPSLLFDTMATVFNNMDGGRAWGSLQPHESQHARPPCPSPTPGVHSDSRPSSQ